MKTLAELKAMRNVAWDAAKKFLGEHSVDGKISAEDKKIYDQMVASVDEYEEQISIVKAMEERDARLAQPVSAPIVNTPADSKVKTGRASDEYKKVFMNFVTGKASKSELRNALQEGSDSEGGYLVPEEFERQIIEKITTLSVIRTLATVISTESTRKIPVLADEGEATWIDEEGQYQEDDDVFGQVVLDAFKCGTIIKVSDELLEDSAFNLEDYITTAFARRIAVKEDAAFMVGNGSKKPTGIFDESGGGDVGVTTASADKITADEIIDLVYSLEEGYSKNAVFFMNKSTAKAIRKLKDGNGDYLWTKGLEGQPSSLMGYPVHLAKGVPAIASGAAVIAFGDLSYYWIADRGAFIMKRLEERYADYGQVGFRGSRRVDAKLTQKEAVKILKMASA